MNCNKHGIYVTATLLALSASNLFAAESGMSVESAVPFVKMGQKANFIHGDNLVTDQLSESEYQAMGLGAERTLEQRAAGLSAVMVTPNGDMMEAKMNPEDVVIFEQGIAAFEKAGHSAALFTQRSIAPIGLRKARQGGISGGADAKGLDSGDVSIETVIGTDNRVQITNTNTYPNYYIGRIDIGCTGTLIGPKHVLTAGHCVSNGYGSWYSSLNFTVAQNGSYKPWGTESWSRAFTTTAWLNNHDSNYDYALIVLADAPHGGYAGWGAYSGGTHRITGYPGDKPFGTMWTDYGSTYTSGSYRICYTIDTYGGNSGSGVADTSGYVRGIHTTGSSTANCGTRLTSTVYSTLQGWIANNP